MALFGLFGPPDVKELVARKNVKGLIRALGYQQDGHVRYMAARALRHFPDGRAVRPLIAALREEDMSIRGAAAEALVAIGAPAVEPLIAALKDTDRNARRAAARALGLIGDPRAVGPLVPLLTGSDLDMSNAAAQALVGLRWKPEGYPGARYCIYHEDWDRCVDIGAPAVPLLIKELKSPKVKVRRGAASALIAIHQSGGLDERRRCLVLAERSEITREHQDRQIHTDRQVQDLRFSDCSYTHADSERHEDAGIGIDFPV